MIKSLKRIVTVLLTSGSMLVLGTLGFASTELEQAVTGSGLSGSYLASRQAINDQDDEAAVRFLLRAVELDPENAKLRQDLLASYVSNGRIDDAVEIARETEVTGNAVNLVAFINAVAEIKKRSWKNVAGSLEGVTGGDLDQTLSKIIAAWGLAGERKVDEAIASLADLEGPEWIKVMRDYHIGLIADSNGRADLASEKYQAVIDNRAVITVLTETYIRAIEARIRNRSKAEDREAVNETLDYGLSLLPDHPPFKNMRSRLARGEVLTPLLASPQTGTAELFYNIATALRRDGAGNFAKSYLQIARYLAEDSDVIIVALAELYLRQGDYERSNAFYEMIAEESPFYRTSHLEMASNLSRLEKTADAISELREQVSENPEELAGYMVLGSILNREKRYKEASEVYDRAVNVIGIPQTHHWNLFFRRGIAYERQKEWEKAEPNFKKSLELSPDQAEVLNYLGYSWIDQGINLDEGMDMIRKAVELRPRSGFIVDSLGWAHYRLGQYEDAVRELERAVELMPQDPTINDHLGDAYWKVGRKLEATFQWKIALASKVPPDNPEIIERKLVEGLLEDSTDAAQVDSGDTKVE